MILPTSLGSGVDYSITQNRMLTSHTGPVVSVYIWRRAVLPVSLCCFDHIEATSSDRQWVITTISRVIVQRWFTLHFFSKYIAWSWESTIKLKVLKDRISQDGKCINRGIDALHLVANRDAWVRFVKIKRQDFTGKTVSDHSALCGLHFSADCFPPLWSMRQSLTHFYLKAKIIPFKKWHHSFKIHFL